MQIVSMHAISQACLSPLIFKQMSTQFSNSLQSGFARLTEAGVAAVAPIDAGASKTAMANVTAEKILVIIDSSIATVDGGK